MKVVINKCFGGFGLSDAGFERYLELKGITWYTGKNKFGYTPYYTVPEEEYLALESACSAKPMGPDRYKELNKMYLSTMDIERDDPLLIQVVEELGEKSWGSYSELKIVEIPDDIEWEISEYDGMESIQEKHRSWR